MPSRLWRPSPTQALVTVQRFGRQDIFVERIGNICVNMCVYIYIGREREKE